MLKFKFVYLIVCLFLLSGCSSWDKSVRVSGGIALGEFANTYKTKRQQAQVEFDVGYFHAGIRHENLWSQKGAVDDKKDSLIDGNITSVGLGIHSTRGTRLTLWENQKYFEIDLENRRNIRWGLGSIVGMSHIDKHGATLTESGGRKTTAAKIGLYYRFNRWLHCDGTYVIRNNTKKTVDDYQLGQCGLRVEFK